MNAQVAQQLALEERVKVLAGQLNAIHVELVALARDAAAEGSWAVPGIRSLSHWLTWQAGLAARTARQVVAVAGAHATHPATCAVFDAGELSLDQVAVAVKAPAHCDARIAELAPMSTVSQIKVEVRVATPAPEPTEPDAPAESVTAGFDGDGRYRMTVELDGDRGRIVDAALSEARDRLFRDGHVAVTWADALVELAERSLDQTPVERQERYRTNLFLDPTASIPATWGDGWAVPDAIRRFLTCDGLLSPVFVQDGRPVNVGRTMRVVPDRTRRLVLRRDVGCRNPRCSATRGLEVHHIVHHEHGGPTDTPNLCALCRRCHRHHHVGKLGISGNADEPDGLTFTDATGRVIDPAVRPRKPTGPPPEPASPYVHPLGERLDSRFLEFLDPPTGGPAGHDGAAAESRAPSVVGIPSRTHLEWRPRLRERPRGSSSQRIQRVSHHRAAREISRGESSHLDQRDGRRCCCPRGQRTSSRPSIINSSTAGQAVDGSNHDSSPRSVETRMSPSAVTR